MPIIALIVIAIFLMRYISKCGSERKELQRSIDDCDESMIWNSIRDYDKTGKIDTDEIDPELIGRAKEAIKDRKNGRIPPCDQMLMR